MLRDGFPRARPGWYIDITKVENLTPKNLEYYGETWGFDPVKDQVKTNEDGYYYETCLPLENDPVLNKVGVKMVVRVEVDSTGTHNRIGFERGDKRSLIECIHTVIYDATPEELADYSPEDYKSLVHTTEGRPAILPPWEHFVSLKSFAAGLVDRGVISTLFCLPAGSHPKKDLADGQLDDQGREPNGLNYQFIDILNEVAPEILKSHIVERAGEIIEQAPENWLRTRAEILTWHYKLDLLFGNTPYLASVDHATLRKLLFLFLSLLCGPSGGHIVQYASTFFTQICVGNFIEKFDSETAQGLVDEICDIYGSHRMIQKINCVLDKIFCILLTREDVALCNPQRLKRVLLYARDPLNAKNNRFDYEFEKKISDDFLSKLLETIFHIWEKDHFSHLGYLPFVLIQHFLRKEENPELLRKFIILAPVEWIVEYWHILNNQFTLEQSFLASSGTVQAVDIRVRKKIASIINRMKVGKGKSKNKIIFS